MSLLRIAVLLPLAAATFCAGARDPVVLSLAGDVWYLFSTGRAPGGHLPIRCSHDLRDWQLCGKVFETIPAWALQEIPGATSLWAPDISFFNG